MISMRLGLALMCSVLLTAAAAAEPASKSRGSFKHEPMIFFVAKGAPNACGPGCDTWIAAEGTFDPDVHERLSEFLNVPSRRRLPIFFHSPGGELQPSIATGNVLRERRMTAGIGQTIPDGCRERPRADAACRKLMASGRVLKARLKVESGICASGCGYALIGASVRLIGEGAKFGVHASRLVPVRTAGQRSARARAAMEREAERQSYDLLKQYVALAGVDPALIDLAMRTPHNRVHWLGRDELSRFGIVPGDYFETEWLRIPVEDGKFTIVKSLTQPSQTDAQEYRTTVIGIDCVAGQRPQVTLRRELPSSEQGTRLAMRMTSGDAFVLVFNEGRRPDATTELRVQPVAADALARAAASDAIVLREEKGGWMRETRLSTRGLSEALTAAPSRCGGALR
ncbi:MAG: hypothetical protein ACOY5F_08125 [Pseudomonadota bacterium]